jgi:hypothetical protein
MKKTRQNNKLELRSDSIGTETALAALPTTKYDICRIARESTQRYLSAQLVALEQQPI